MIPQYHYNLLQTSYPRGPLHAGDAGKDQVSGGTFAQSEVPVDASPGNPSCNVLGGFLSEEPIKKIQ